MTKRQGATSENGFILEKLTKIEKEKIIFSELFRKSFHLSTYIYLWIEMKSFPPPKKNFKFHAWVKKYHFGHSSEVG